MSHQLTLDVKLNEPFNLDNFTVGDNVELMAFLRRFVTELNDRFLYLWGAEGVGRSHLLQACCEAITHQNLKSIYIPLKQKAGITPAELQNLALVNLIAIDDVDLIAHNADWQEALFHLYNRIKSRRRTRLLLVGPCPPAQLNLSLADLSSRLSWGMVMQVKVLSDEEKQSALIQTAKARGMQLADDVAQFLIQRSPRDMRDLFAMLDILDDASLRAKRRLTIPFVKDVLGF